MSDIHLNFKFGGLPQQIAVLLKNELWQTFCAALDYAQEQTVDIILLAGDLFDTPTPDASLIQDVKDHFAKIAPIKIMVVAGNHDYAYAGSFWENQDWPENVYIFPTNWQSVDLPDLKTKVWGASFMAPYVKEPQIRQADYTSTDLQLGILHGDALTPDNSLYDPLTPTDIQDSGLDWLAIGHIHKRESGQAGHTNYGYAGSLAGHGFDETGEKGVLLLTFNDKRMLSSEFHALSQRRYEKVTVDISGAATNQEAVQKINDFLADKYGIDFEQNLYEITVVGFLEPNSLVKVGNLVNELNVFYVRLRDETQLVIDYQALAKQDTLQGNFVKKILDKIEQADDVKQPLLKDALQYGIKAFEGGINDEA
jgi:DNA repair exonuclease SbcCD nuclease subunit